MCFVVVACPVKCGCNIATSAESPKKIRWTMSDVSGCEVRDRPAELVEGHGTVFMYSSAYMPIWVHIDNRPETGSTVSSVGLGYLRSGAASIL